MKIPAFVSCPTVLNDSQKISRKILLKLISELNVKPRALGRSDYPSEFPLREVLVIARHCAGGIILGFEQFRVETGVWKMGAGKNNGERNVSSNEKLVFPSPWNQLEAGILFGLGLPILIFKEDNISGGVFDHGVTDVFVHKMPNENTGPKELKGLKEIMLKWYGKVSQNYYAFKPRF